MTVETDAAHFERAIGRVRVMALSLSGAGTVAVWHFQGWAWALGFLAGAAASLLNFRWLHQLVASLGEGGHRPRKRLLLFLSLRYLLLGLAGYVIVVYFRLNLAAALMGLFVPVVAVILEILYELLYART